MQNNNNNVICMPPVSRLNIGKKRQGKISQVKIRHGGVLFY